MAEQNSAKDLSNLSRFIGCRVVRGPDWKWTKQDGGEGHVGTIRSFESSEEVVVVWDNGTGANYRCSVEFDIRILEPSPCGFFHESVKCHECGQDPLYGIRWVCADCLANDNRNINLCSRCYHDDKHQTKHRFFRILTHLSEKVLVEPRKKSKKLSFKGIYPGAKVVRGIDWSWDDQDNSGSSCKGKVIQVKDWNSKSPLSGVFVNWESGNKNLYRLGFEGMSDLKCVSDAKGGYYYRDHLPVLGDKDYRKCKKNINDVRSDAVSEEDRKKKLKIFKNSPVQNVSKSITSSNSSIIDEAKIFKVNDRVNIDLDFEVVQSLQIGHGGWCEAMFECLGNTGVITNIDSDNDFEVTYSSGNKWTLNPAVLSLAQESSSENKNMNNLDERSSNLPKCSIQSSNLIDLFSNNLTKYQDSIFRVEDLVEISSDMELVKKLQYGHGEWAEAMLPTLGQIGKIVKIYDDNDLKIEVCGTTWTFNPLVVGKVDQTKNKKFIITKELSEELVKAAANGEMEKCEYILGMTGANVNSFFAGHSALHAASQNGHLEVIKLLIGSNVDVEAEDKDGDRAIHHAAFGNEPKVIEILFSMEGKELKSSLELNSRNKKMQTALHIAVNKAHVEVVKILLNYGAHPSLQDVDGDTPLHDAITKKNDEIIQLLLEANADISVCNKHGFNAIHHAALRGNVSSMKCLLDKIISLEKHWLIDEKKEDGFSALHLACLNSYQEVVELMLNYSRFLNINIQNNSLQTPLHFAIERLNYEIAKSLILNKISKCDLNAKDKDGDTPLHSLLKNYTISLLKNFKDLRQKNDGSSFEKGPNRAENVSEPGEKMNKAEFHKIALMLIENGASISIKNKKNQTPLDLCNDPEFGKILAIHNSETIKLHSAQQNLKIDFDECPICCDKRQEVLFKPCNHLNACKECSSRLKKCLICKEAILDRIQLEKCVICGEHVSNVLMEPCGHIQTCESCSKPLQKCTKCRMPVEKQINIVSSKMESTNGKNLDGNCLNLKKLQQQLQDIKEQTMCPVCMDKQKNMVFLCGHGTCQLCGDQMNECPICRKLIQKKILIY
ncbi:E3 ubiquitin- ligase MIB1 [Brachionus plicatilis]|uniref:RING-type E3 ubiquitin transferase n=1 Tax=Brachionus plicatilis TaxID=10195 RepID=A0A3M7RV86_BRAPC|nr:E3 ubiquitin- ligase MIB1 [Brachionus plicatilis]